MTQSVKHKKAKDKKEINKKSNTLKKKDFNRNMDNYEKKRSSQNQKKNDKDKVKKSEKVNSSDACVYAKKCGGCAFQGIAYDKQLRKKQKWVDELLAPFCKVEPIVGMENPKNYRHKVHAAFGFVKGKGTVAGVYKEGTHQIVDIESCQIENEKADAIIRDIKDLMSSFKIKAYDEDHDFGLLRHVLIRVGYHTGEIMVVLVLASPILPSKNNFIKALLKLHPEISTVVLNVNAKQTSMVLGDKNTVLYGKGYIEDVLCEKTFRISPSSFYQVNPKQTEVLYKKAIELANLTGVERVIDAYCGTGTIGIIAADYVKEVIGVELNRDAVKDAIINAKRNQVKNISFYQADAGKFMVQLAEQNEKIDVVIMDPPRSGSSEVFLQSVIKLAPANVVYVSCNPETLARDLKVLVKAGYQAKTAIPVDMFPFAEHVETCALLTKTSGA